MLHESSIVIIGAGSCWLFFLLGSVSLGVQAYIAVNSTELLFG